MEGLANNTLKLWAQQDLQIIQFLSDKQAASYNRHLMLSSGFCTHTHNHIPSPIISHTNTHTHKHTTHNISHIHNYMHTLKHISNTHTTHIHTETHLTHSYMHNLATLQKYWSQHNFPHTFLLWSIFLTSCWNHLCSVRFICFGAGVSLCSQEEGQTLCAAQVGFELLVLLLQLLGCWDYCHRSPLQVSFQHFKMSNSEVKSIYGVSRSNYKYLVLTGKGDLRKGLHKSIKIRSLHQSFIR